METKTSSKKVPTLFSLRQTASRSFPLGSILVLVALTSCCMIQPGTEIVFNTLAPDCTYDRDYRNTIVKAFASSGKGDIIKEQAARFTAETSGNLATVYLGLTNEYASYNRKWGGPVRVFLCGDVAGFPNIATQTYLGTVAPTEFYRTTNNSIVSLVVAGKVPVVEGWHYWLVLKPGPPPIETPFELERLPLADNWHYSLPKVFGMTAYRLNVASGGKWQHNPEFYPLPAFGITAWPRPWANSFRVLEGPYQQLKGP